MVARTIVRWTIKSQEIKDLLEPRFEKRFGDVAVAKKYINLKQLIEAMSIQVQEEAKTGKHRLLGEILIGMGTMNASQVSKVLNAMKK